MSAHKKRGGLFTFFKKKGEKNDKQENIKARKDSVISRESGVISTENSKKKSTRMQSTDNDTISQCTISSVITNGILPNANTEVEHRKGESSSLNSISQLIEIENCKKSKEDVEMKAKDERQTEKNSSDRKFDTTISNTDTTTHILTENHVISNKPTDGVQHPVESEQRDKALKGEQQQQQQTQMNAADIVKHKEHDNSELKHEEMKTYEVDEVSTRPRKYSPIPSDPSLTPLTASDNQSESTTGEGKVVSEESEEVLNRRGITHPNGSFPVGEPLPLGSNRDVHILVDHTSPTSGKVFQFSEEKRSSSVRNLAPEEKPVVGSLQHASSTLKSVSMASLPHDDGKKTTRNTDITTAGQKKVYEAGIIHYAPERFAGVKERNAQFGGLSPPPIKKELKTNIIITEQQHTPEVLSVKDEQLTKKESLTGDEEDPLQKEYTKLRVLFEQWQSHCADPIAVKKAYTLKLQGELIAQLKLVQDLCSKIPPQQLVNQPALTIPMLSAPLKKRPAIINYKFAPPSPKTSTPPQISPKSERKTSANNQSTKPPDNNANSSPKKNSSLETVTSEAPHSAIGGPHSYTPLMRNEFSVPRMREPNNFEPHTIAVSSYRQRPELHTISYGTTITKSANLRTQEGSTNAASEAERDWRNKNAEIVKMDTKGWVTSTLRLGSSTAKIERHDEKENAFRRIQREIEMEAQRQREFNRMRQQLSIATTIQEEIEEDEQNHLKENHLKEERPEKSSSQPSTQRTTKALSYAKQFDAKIAEKVNPTTNVLRSSHASTAHQYKKMSASTNAVGNQVQADASAKSIPSSDTNIKQSTKNISKNFNKNSSQEINRVQRQCPNSTDNIRQIVEKVKLNATSQRHLTGTDATSTNKPEGLNAHRILENRSAINDHRSVPISIRKNDRSSIIEADQGNRSTMRSSDQQHSASRDANCNLETQRSITTNIHSVISSAKNSTMRSQGENLNMNVQKNQQRNITSNEESYGKEAQRLRKEDSDDKKTHSCGDQFVIPELRKVGTPVERIGIQLGFVREDKEDVDREMKAGTSTSTSISTQQEHSSKLASVPNVDELGNSATVCNPSVVAPPPPPGPAPIIAHLRSPRSECSLSSWGQSAGSEHGSNSSLITPGVESVDERKERFRKSLSHLATIDPAVLLAEMKEVHLRPTHPVQKSKSSDSNDLHSNLMREICEAGGTKSLKKTSTPT